MTNKKYVISYISNKKYKDKLFVIIGDAIDISKTKFKKLYYLYSFDKRQASCVNFLVKDYNKNEFPYVDGDIDDVKQKFKTLGGELVAECSLLNTTNDHSFINNDLHMILSYTDSMVKYKFIELDDLYVYPEYRNNGFARMLINEIFDNAIMKNCLVYVCAGALVKEYPEEPDIIELKRIANSLAKFYEKIGFISINDICYFESKHALLRLNEESARLLINYYKA